MLDEPFAQVCRSLSLLDRLGPIDMLNGLCRETRFCRLKAEMMGKLSSIERASRQSMNGCSGRDGELRVENGSKALSRRSLSGAVRAVILAKWARAEHRSHSRHVVCRTSSGELRGSRARPAGRSAQRTGQCSQGRRLKVHDTRGKTVGLASLSLGCRIAVDTVIAVKVIIESA